MGLLAGGRIALIPAVVMVLMLLLMVRLGFWQLDRAEQAKVRISAFETQRQVTPISPTAEDNIERYSLVSLEGRFLNDTQIIMDGFSKDKTAGYQVLTPFEIKNGSVVMVNRGWRPWVGRRQEVNDLDVSEDSMVIAGRVDNFWQPGLVLGSGNSEEQQSWPRLSVYPQFEEIQVWLDREILSWQLLLDAKDPNGYVRRWQPSGLSPERHTGYAIQWFTMSVALIVLALFSMRKTAPHSTDANSR